MSDDLNKIKVSELPDAGTAIDDLYALGSKTVSGSPQSFKVNLGTATSARAAAQIAAALVNYYTKLETYNRTEVNNLIGAIQQFHYEIYPSLASVTNPQSNVLYLIGPTGSGSDKYEEYVYANSTWTKIGDTTIDLSDYSTTEEVEAMLNSLWSDVLEELDKKANKDGWYSKMVVGAAESLIGKELSEAVISYRASTSGSGAASIAKIKGRTDAWNQLVRNGHFESTSDWIVGGATLTVNSGIASLQITNTPTHNYDAYISQGYNLVAGHKYLQILSVYCPHSGTFRIDSNGGFTAESDIAVTANTWVDIALIKTAQITAGRNITMYPMEVTDGYAAGDIFKVKGVNLYDLTLQYGAGREPSTVAAFLADYPEALTAPYNAGKLVSNKMTALVTDGFNQWDEQWEVGGIYSSNGANNNSVTNRIRSKNYCRCFPNTIYYGKNNDIDSVAIFWYDVNKTYISYTTFAAGGGLSTSPNGAYYFRISPNQTYTTYKNDIAINLSHSGIRNGEYEPYWTSTHNIVHSKIYGKLNGAGERVQIAPYGFRGVGTNYDEVDVVRKEAYIRRAWVDMGTLAWRLRIGAFEAVVPDAANTINRICPKYGVTRSVIAASDFTSLPDKTCATNISSGNWTIGSLLVKDSGYADAAAFKAAMSGVMLDFQLATPLHYTDLMYSEDGGQTFIELPSNYRVDDFGTERRLPDGIVDGAPASTPLVALINYPINLPKTYQNQDSMDDLLNKLASALGLTWSKTWDGVKYVYTITNNS